MEIVQAETLERLGWARDLFRAYAESLPFDLAFQGFAAELAGLPGGYVPPLGALLVASCEGSPAGCVAFHQWEPGVCEMKRLFVSPAFRGRSIGRLLAVEAIILAARAGYRAMRLDTVPSMRTARRLYTSLGFTEIAPYRHNPIPGTAYLQLDLADYNAK